MIIDFLCQFFEILSHTRLYKFTGMTDAVAHCVDGADAGFRVMVTLKEVSTGTTVHYNFFGTIYFS